MRATQAGLGGLLRRGWLVASGLLMLACAAQLQAQVIYTYENTTPGTFNNNCPGGIDRTFVVPAAEAFAVGGNGTIAVGVDALNNRRSDLRILLIAPNLNTVTLADGVAADDFNNYFVTFSSNNDLQNGTENLLNDGTDDPVAVARYRRLVGVAALDTFYTGTSQGTWTLRICDDATGGGTDSTFQSARLILRNNSQTAPAACASNSTFDWGANGDLVAFASAVFPPDNITLTQVSTTGEAPTDDVANQPSYITRTTETGAHFGHYRFQMNTTGNTELTAESTLFGFSAPVTGLDFELLDVDRTAPPGSGWEDYVRVEATGPSGARVPYQMTFTAPTNASYAGDWGETDETYPSDQNGGNVRYRFIGAVSQVRVAYAQGNEPATDSVGQFIGIADFSFCAFDYGDAPNSYGTNLVSSGPRHNLQERARLFIGSTPPDGETNGVPSAGADGDDGSLTNDEASAVTFPPQPLPIPNQPWVCGSFSTNPSLRQYCVTVNVTNTTGLPAQLVGWVDFNDNGDFLQAGERSLPDLQSTLSTGFTSGNIPTGSTNFSAVLVFSSPTPIPNNVTTSMIRLRLTTDPVFFSDITPPSHLGAVRDGEVVDQAIPINTLPVTLSLFSSERLSASQLAVRWNVATEAGTIGYRVLQADTNGELQALNRDLLPATGIDSLLPQFYETTVISSSNAPLHLEEISRQGRSERFGPYAIGATKGESLTFTAAPWAAARSEQAQASSRQVAERRAVQTQLGVLAAEIRVDKSGMQRVSVADLQAIGVDLSGRDSRLLRLREGASFVALRVVPDGVLTASSVIEFYGRALTGSQYSRVRPYQLSAEGGAGPVPGFAVESAAPLPGPAADLVRREVALDSDRFYSFAAPGKDPWYFDTVRRNGAITSKSWNLPIDGLREGQASLALDVWGGVDYPGNLPDHRYRVLVNGTALGERTFDGVSSDSAAWALPAGVLQEGANEVRIELLATGQPVDIVRVESIRISAVTLARSLDALDGLHSGALAPVSDGLFSGTFEVTEPALFCGLACEQLRIVGLPDSDVVALRIHGDKITELQGALVTPGVSGFDVLLKPAQLLSQGDDLSDGERLFVLSRSQFQRPQLRPSAVLQHPLNGDPAQLLLIAPHRYLADVEPLLQARRAEGLSASVVDVEQIYAYYSGGIVDPMAIRRFLQQAQSTLSTEYVLLVGGDTYDYFDRLQLGSISDVPTLYGRTHAVVNHAPLDHALVDFNDDGNPELAIGRLPVRTSAELRTLIARILTPGNAAPSRSLFIAERANPVEGSDYAAELDQVIARMPTQWQALAQRVYLDQYPSGAAGVAQARAAMVDSIMAGQSLVSYFGHGSPTVWSREQLVQSSQLSSLFGAGQGPSPVVTEFGCWGGYFVAPQYNTMSHGWLMAGSRAANAVFASTALTEHYSDQRMAEVLLPALARPGVRLGDALRLAKQTLHATEPELQDVLRGMSLFGDPSMRMGN